MTNEELLAAWDAGQPVKLVEMGGLGPGYEMCIQLMGMEWLRFMGEIKPDLDDVELLRAKRDEWDAVILKRIEPLGLRDNYGPSGAQWGAARNIGMVIHKNGYEKAMSMVETDRHITVTKQPFVVPA